MTTSPGVCQGQEARRTGRRGERVARRWLRRRGWRIVHRNQQVGVDEIDIVAESPDGRLLACIEVKTSRSPGEPLRRVDGGKRHRLLRSARRLAPRYPDHLVRIDVMTVVLVPWRPSRVQHVTNAVSDPGPGAVRPRAGCGRVPRAEAVRRGSRP